jgi:tetratricopeptide (TPR) repeat protein
MNLGHLNGIPGDDPRTRIQKSNIPTPPPAQSIPSPGSNSVDAPSVAPSSGDSAADVKTANAYELNGEVTFGNVRSVSATSAVSNPELETDDPQALGATIMLFQEGMAAYRSGDAEMGAFFFEEAYNCAIEASGDRGPAREDARILYNWGCCLQETGQTDQAQQRFEEARAINPFDLELQQRIQHRMTL